MLKRMTSIVLSVALVLTCLIAGLVLPTSAATSDNLLTGGDFEGAATDGWTWASSPSNQEKYAIISEEYGKAQITTDPTDSSNHCLIFNASEDGKMYNGYYKATPVVAGKKYRLSMRYKGTGLRVYLEKTNCTPNGTFNPDSATEWTYYEVVFTVKESMTNKNFIFNFGHVEGEGTAYLDDVCLTEVIDPTGIAFEESSYTIAKGESAKLALTVSPTGAQLENAVTYLSSNTDVATVAADGTVTAVSAGVAYITASADGFVATTAVVVSATDNKWTDTNMLVDGDLEAETLSTNWAKFTAATDFVTHTTDPADNSNHVLKIVGQKTPNYQKIAGIKGDTYYLFTFRHKGKGRVNIAFTNTYVDTDSVVLDTTDFVNGSGSNDRRWFVNTKSEWQTINVIFKTTASPNNSWVLQFGSPDKDNEIYLDDFSLVELGKATVADTVAGGSVSLSSGSTSGTALTGLTEGATVTATVTPESGYLMVPGSLRYTTPDGFTKRILNKDGDFGTGAGNTFTFKKPLENIRVFADFVKTDSTNFAWGTVGTSVHIDNESNNDGIRFLTRVNLTAFDETANGLSVKYEGETYTVKQLGLLLKRASNAKELTLDNWSAYGAANADEKIWGVQVYSDTTNNYTLTDYTDTYFDYTIAMITSNPNETFNARPYTARGYLVLEKGGVETVLYADERTDSVNTALARENGELSDDSIVSGEVPPVVTPPEVNEPTIPSDDKDYSNADLKILSIGNSYSQDAHKYLQAMAAKEGKTFKCVNLYKAGCALSTHANGWANNEAIYQYELNSKALTDDDSMVSLKAVLESDQFDVVTLQQASWTSVKYSNYQPYLNNLIAVIHEKQPNAKIYLQQTWAYGDAHDEHVSRPDYTGGTMAAMWAKIETAYNSAAAETGLELIPAGQAIMNAQTALNAGSYSVTSIQRDNSHVSYTWGRYLLARVWYETLTGETPDVTLNELNASVAADSAMETLVKNAAAAALAEYN